MKQHESNCNNHSNPSAVVNHNELGDSIDYANSCVIYPESHITKRTIAESLLLCQQHNQVMEGNIISFRLRVFQQKRDSHLLPINFVLVATFAIFFPNFFSSLTITLFNYRH